MYETSLPHPPAELSSWFRSKQSSGPRTIPTEQETIISDMLIPASISAIDIAFTMQLKIDLLGEGVILNQYERYDIVLSSNRNNNSKIILIIILKWYPSVSKTVIATRISERGYISNTIISFTISSNILSNSETLLSPIRRFFLSVPLNGASNNRQAALPCSNKLDFRLRKTIVTRIYTFSFV